MFSILRLFYSNVRCILDFCICFDDTLESIIFLTIILTKKLEIRVYIHSTCYDCAVDKFCFEFVTVR